MNRVAYTPKDPGSPSNPTLLLMTASSVERRVCEGRIRVRLDGPENGRPLVLLHGMMCRLEMFDELVAELPAHTRVIRIDFRGHGESQRSKSSYGLDDLADDVEFALDELNVRRADVLGFSMGGMVALRLALRSPERIERLILTSTSADEERMRVRVRLIAISRVMRTFGATGKIIDEAARTMFRSWYRREHADRVELWKNRIAAMPRKDMFYSMDAVANRTSLIGTLPHLRFPVLIIHGEWDKALPLVNAQKMHERLPDAQLHVIPEGGHGIVLESSRRVAMAIEEFLTDPDLATQEMRPIVRERS